MKFAILVPTYNEATSIVELLDSLSTLRETGTYQFDVLVIDDNSPDATAEIVGQRGLPWVRILKREKKDGLGNAYRAGFSTILKKTPAMTRLSRWMPMDLTEFKICQLCLQPLALVAP